jgi:hypothetical protein
MPATVRRNRLPRWPRPKVSRPSARASAKSRSSIAITRQPWALARAMSWLTAARSRPSRVVAQASSRSRGIVCGLPNGLPAGSSTTQSKWPALRSTATRGKPASSAVVGTGRHGWVQEASRYPAIPLGLVADVVADRTGGDLRRPRFGPVGEPDRAGQPVATVRPVGQIPQRGGQLQLQPALLRVDQDGAVAKRIPRVSIGGQKPAGRLPLLPPLRLGEPGRVQMLTGMEQPPPTADDADSTLRDTRLHTSQPRGEEVQTPPVSASCESSRYHRSRGGIARPGRDRPAERGVHRRRAAPAHPAPRPAAACGCGRPVGRHHKRRRDRAKWARHRDDLLQE